MKIEITDSACLLPGKDLSWLTQLRATGQNYFDRHGLPTTKDELWRYTRVAPIAEPAWTLTPAAVDAKNIAARIPTLAPQCMVFVDGAFSPALSTQQELPASVIVDDLANILKTQPEMLKNKLGHIAPLTQGFTALNTALLTQGMCVIVPDDVQLEKPLHVVCVQTQAELTHQWRHVIYLGQRSQATIIEHYLGLDEVCYFNNGVSEIHLAAQANLVYCKLQQESHSAYHISSTHVQLKQGAHLQGYGFNRGSALSRSDVHVQLMEKNAACQWRGLFNAREKQHLDQHVLMQHMASQTHSDVLVKGIAAEQAQGIFNGKIAVAADTQKIHAELASHNLLLDSTAAIHTKPDLEIYADDVKCSHGATVGQLDEQALFYLRTRGLSQSLAEQLLITAFMQTIFSTVTDKTVCDYVEDMFVA